MHAAHPAADPLVAFGCGHCTFPARTRRSASQDRQDDDGDKEDDHRREQTKSGDTMFATRACDGSCQEDEISIPPGARGVVRGRPRPASLSGRITGAVVDMHASDAMPQLDQLRL